VSHELKTPLAAIQEASSLLRDQIPGPLLTSQQEIVAITLSNTRLLRQRVDALLMHDAANWLERPGHGAA
jgi:two-component system sensor histidine kinase GlrK